MPRIILVMSLLLLLKDWAEEKAAVTAHGHADADLTKPGALF